MNAQSGLSFEQAPPISAPLRFFLTAPWFGVLAAALLLWLGPAALQGRWLPPVIAATHLMTLGFLGLVMIGAMMQMLPVVAGSPIPRPRLAAGLVHGLLVPGVLALALGLLSGRSWPVHLALALLGTGFGIFLAAAGLSLKRAGAANPTVTAMKLAVISLAITVTLGLTLATNYAFGWWLPERARFANLHLSWGLLGWVGLLVVGVAYQVVPMFQLTPSYPKRLTRWLAGLLFLLLLLWSVAWLHPAMHGLAGLGIALGFAAFGRATLGLQRRRRRRQFDATLWFWRVGMVSLLAAATLWLAGELHPEWAQAPHYPWLMGILMIVGFGVSVVNGMLYKIVPFLIWFHLQSRLMGRAKVPNMKEILREPAARRQMALHFAALPLLVLAAPWPPLLYPAAALFGASMALLGWNLGGAWGVYRRHAD